ncbi:MAG: VPDSG-CTERM sorting domain-containing protein [Limisphaera sp.]|nr:VPDSG-CTERM sorting domain-containing protein [Limisphaera sp.]
MMSAWKKQCLVVAAAVMMAGSASAIVTVTVSRTAGYYDTTYGGGEFTLKGSPWANPAHYSSKTLVAGGFQTFCLELNEGISGQPFAAELSLTAINGGLGGGTPDPLSIGTAWIYKQFAEGNLAGYNYTPGAGREASARALQETIWWLENEQGDPGAGNPFRNLILAKFGTVAAARADYDPSTAGFNVRVVNMYGIDKITGQPDYTAKKQDMIVYLPDGGMTLVLMGGGLLGLAILRRKE